MATRYDLVTEQALEALKTPFDPAVASLVGNPSTATGAELEARYPSAVVMSGAGIDPTGVADSTAAVQAKVDAAGTSGQRMFVPPGTYVIGSVSITGNLVVECAPGVTFRRKAGADVASGSYWAPGAGLFEVNTPGLSVQFSDFTYDGNNAAQTTTEPTGFFLKTYPTATPGVLPTRVRITRGRFINGTSGYLCLRGDDVRRRYETCVYLDDCTFTETVRGIGKGDPGTPSLLGYLPTYVLVLDYVTLVTRNFAATWDTPNGLGQYAACAINGTYYGSDSTLSGECSIYMHGTTYLRGMGRSHKKWDNNADYLTNNGIGAIDAYGNSETLYVAHVVADDCENISVRAKASIKNYTVGSAILTNCHRGLQVSPATTGAGEAVVKVGSVTCYGGTVPQVEFVGTSTTDRVPSVSIDTVRVTGPLTNPEGLVTEGAVHLRNVEFASVRDVTVEGAPGRGVSVVAVDRATLRGVTVDGAGTQGVFTSFGGTLFELDDFTVRNTGGFAVSLSGNTTRIKVSHGVTASAVDYGLFSDNTTSDLTVVDVAASTITGLSRAFYAAGGDAAFIHCKSGAGVTTALTTEAGTRRREDHNSWNPTDTWGTFSTTTVGTAQLGDRVWNLSPVAGGTVGWVCVTAGSPGTWKTFGAISA